MEKSTYRETAFEVDDGGQPHVLALFGGIRLAFLIVIHCLSNSREYRRLLPEELCVETSQLLLTIIGVEVRRSNRPQDVDTVHYSFHLIHISSVNSTARRCQG